MITKESLFGKPQKKPQTKADMTDSVSRSIIETEGAVRAAKIQKLREARLEMEAQTPVPVKKTRAVKATGKVAKAAHAG